MKAVQINSYGPVEVLEVNQNAPKPEITKGQVLVEIHAASINPIDWKLREGYLKGMVPLTFPATLGLDFSGKIIKIGENVTNFKAGDEVFGQAGILNSGSGSFAQAAAAVPTKIAPKPKILDHIQSASLPLAAVSALQAIEEHINLKKGQKILIHGGAGGIGSIAIQIAKAKGAYVATTVSKNETEFVKSLGADEVIDYKLSFSSNKSEAFEDKLSGFDAVFDTVGGETQEKSFKVLKKGGSLVSMVGQPDLELAKSHGVTAIGQMTDITPERLSRITDLIEKGKVKPQIDKVFELDEAKEAFEHLEKGHPRGKVVFKIK